MIYLYSLLAGLAAGSFANVCIFRMPADLSVVWPRSFCPGCKHPISAFQNVPVFSFLWLRGRCASCKAKISWQYPLIEALMAAIFVFHADRYGMDIPRLIITDVMAFMLLCISIIDFKHFIIPDELSFSMMAIGLAISFWNPFLDGSPWMRAAQSLAAGVSGGAVMLALGWAGEKIFKKEALGGGDVKFIAGTGAMLGWLGLLGPLFIGSFIGGLGALVLILGGKKKLGETLPFGPFLSIGAYITCLFPSILSIVFGNV